ncbi:MAG: triose-phosphate isomerase [Spirochaetota bacterium]
MRQPFLAGNWKMHKTVSEATDLARELVLELSSSSNKLMIAPPFTALAAVNAVVQGSKILLGAQNMAAEETGAHTGEVSVIMLRDVGVKVVILGHSERRHTYGETDELVNRKVRLALDHGMEVILCVGETIEEREAGRVEDVVGTQLRAGLEGVGESDLRRVTIAYEPVWAIGTGKTATPEDADAVHAFIRKEVADAYSQDVADELIVQYGGSVKPGNVNELMAMENIDGALVGGASLELESFAAIATYNE